MTDPIRTLTHAAEFHVTCWASRNDGTAAGDDLDLDVTVEFAPQLEDEATGVQAFTEQMDEWLDTYVRNKDLTHVFDFAPTVGNLALRFAHVLEQYAAGRIGSVTVARLDHHNTVSAAVRYME